MSSAQFTLDTAIHLTADFMRDIACGNAHVKVRVKGYWSSDVMTMYIRRTSKLLDKDESWKFEISHSSGGRDTNEVKSDLEAETNFGQALVALAAYGQYLETLVDQFESAHQAYRAEVTAQAAAERAAKDAALAADPALGEDAAKKLVKQIKAVEGAEIVVYRRADADPHLTVMRSENYAGHVHLVSKNGTRWTPKELIERLKDMSTRTKLVIAATA